MLLKVVIGLGALIMLAVFSAAGLQSRQPPPASEAEAEAAVQESVTTVGEPGQDWLISSAGSLVPRDEALAFLEQTRFVAGRTVVITLKARLTDLLIDGEKLPEEPYLQVLADIRAPKVATGACSALQEVLAAECALHSARVVDSSVDPAQGTAAFRIELAYTLKPSAESLPDLAARAFAADDLSLGFEAGTEGAGTVGDLIRSAVSAAGQACAAQKRSDACRVMRMDLQWEGDGAGAARVVIGSLKPLPKGMFPAPPLG